MDPISTRVISAIRASAMHPLPDEIAPDASFVTDLGFDSMGIVTLSVALEEAFDRPILLDRWLGSASDPTRLTVESLCKHLRSTLADEAAALPR